MYTVCVCVCLCVHVCARVHAMIFSMLKRISNKALVRDGAEWGHGGAGTDWKELKQALSENCAVRYDHPTGNFFLGYLIQHHSLVYAVCLHVKFPAMVAFTYLKAFWLQNSYQ